MRLNALNRYFAKLFLRCLVAILLAFLIAWIVLIWGGVAR